MKHKSTRLESACPCGSPDCYVKCCERWHTGGLAPTPEALMRSRYSAYALGLAGYLLKTWHGSTRPATLELDPAVKWIGLKLIASAMQDPDHGTVEFVARCRIGGRAERMHEKSRFVLQDGRWFYVDGDFVEG